MSAETEQKLSALVSSAAQDVSALVRGEIALAKAEMRQDMKQAAAGGGLFGAAAVLGVFALIMLCFAAAYGLHATGLGLAWCWLIVAGAFLLVAGICTLIGRARFKRIRGVEATRRSTSRTLTVLRRADG
jgi:membrane protein implicated in regulation of membrane protease activity